MNNYKQEPKLIDGKLVWERVPTASLDEDVLSTVAQPFATGGGLHFDAGQFGAWHIQTVLRFPKTTGIVEAPAVVFDDQEDFLSAFKRGELEKDFVAVIRFQGQAPTGCRNCIS